MQNSDVEAGDLWSSQTEFGLNRRQTLKADDTSIPESAWGLGGSSTGNSNAHEYAIRLSKKVNPWLWCSCSWEVTPGGITLES